MTAVLDIALEKAVSENSHISKSEFIRDAVRRKLEDLGFDVQLLGSRWYVMEKLQALSSADIDALKEVFCRNSHPRLKKEVTRSGEGRNLPWGCLEDYKRSVQEASLERVAGFIRIAGMLLQKKVYLFWDRGS